MKISDVRVRIIKKDDNKLKAVASITIDECFVVHDIKVIEGNQGYFIAMPSRKTLDGEYKDIVHPLNTETREEIRAAILAEFEKAQKEDKVIFGGRLGMYKYFDMHQVVDEALKCVKKELEKK